MIQTVEFTQLNPMSMTMRESLRALRTNIQFCGNDIRTILFTSTVPNEGKSTVVMDLARSLGESGKRILLIDTDIRKSVIMREYSVKSVSHRQIFGLSHYLSGQKSLNEVLCRTNISNVDIVFAGRSVPNPTEILGTRYYTDLLEFGRTNYDYVLLDCAPVSVAIDAVLEAHYCDGAVLVISQDTASTRMIRDSKRQLENSGVRILGAVLNKVRMDASRYGRYYGSYYGSYYGKHYGHYGHSGDPNDSSDGDGWLDDPSDDEGWTDDSFADDDRDDEGSRKYSKAYGKANQKTYPPPGDGQNEDVEWMTL